MQDTTALREPLDVSTIEDEIQALVDRGSPTAYAPQKRRVLNRPMRPDVESRVQDVTEMVEQTRTEDASEVSDSINHPRHYTIHPSGVECIIITEWMNFCLGNAVKYIWRASEKGATIEDLKKARWYLDREIARLEKLAS